MDVICLISYRSFNARFTCLISHRSPNARFNRSSRNIHFPFFPHLPSPDDTSHFTWEKDATEGRIIFFFFQFISAAVSSVTATQHCAKYLGRIPSRFPSGRIRPPFGTRLHLTPEISVTVDTKRRENNLMSSSAIFRNAENKEASVLPVKRSPGSCWPPPTLSYLATHFPPRLPTLLFFSFGFCSAESAFLATRNKNGVLVSPHIASLLHLVSPTGCRPFSPFSWGGHSI